MTAQGLDELISGRCERDRRFILRLSIVILSLLPISLLHLSFVGRLGLTDFLSEFLTLAIGVILVVGVLSIPAYHRTRLIPFWKVMSFAAMISFAAVVVSIPGGWLLDIEFSIGKIAIDLGRFSYQNSMLGFILTLGLVWMLMVMLLLIGFGLMGVLAAIQRSTVPYVVKTAADMDWEGDPWHYRVVAWLFMFPATLEIDEVLYKRPMGRGGFPSAPMTDAFAWELVFAAIIAVYISLNPLIIATGSLSESMGVSFALSVFVSLIVLPWSIYRKMDLRASSRPRDYVFYKGMKDRMTQVGFTLSTILILLKWGLDYVSLMDVIVPFIGYFLFNILIAVMFTFIYFNNFEDEIARFLVRVFRDREDLKVGLINE